jgi:hypothetical protein
LTVAPCCYAAPAAPVSQAKRSIDPPNLQPAALAVRSFPPVPRHVRLPQVAGELAPLTSRLRLSVVLLI